MLLVLAGILLGLNLRPRFDGQRSFVASYTEDGGAFDPQIETARCEVYGWPLTVCRTEFTVHYESSRTPVNNIQLPIEQPELQWDWKFGVPGNLAIASGILVMMALILEGAMRRRAGRPASRLLPGAEPPRDD
ncbi:MAG: hypothetical protein M5U26_26305 [Planctomycetota bacterium]|nr:hypothetical protein [Planctomycetota bacterium]